jgi:CheY-like chemotaxis protein
MVQMVGNLLNNALKFTQPGGQVHVSIRMLGVACEVSVRDDGIGIDPQELDSIFDPFVQVERARSGAQGGMGIGLALVRELAISHGGRVHALSEGPGQGTEIVLTLPLALVQKDEGTPAGPAKIQPRTPGLSILLVEDNEDARESLALLLTLNGHEVSVVTTGRAGVEAVSTHPPDVLICDVGLPDLSGFQVIRAIRAAHPSAGVFAIALTGYAQPQDRDQAFQSGFDAHLAKPPDFAELDQILSEVARRKASSSAT